MRGWGGAGRGESQAAPSGGRSETWPQPGARPAAQFWPGPEGWADPPLVPLSDGKAHSSPACLVTCHFVLQSTGIPRDQGWVWSTSGCPVARTVVSF